MSETKPLTFVTAFLDLQGHHNEERPPEVRFKHFQTLFEAQIPIIVFLSRRFESEIAPFVCKNVVVIYTELMETETAKIIHTPPTLPESRNIAHDNANFLLLMNAKSEFVQTAIRMNPFHSTHFAWVDFNVAHIFKDRAASIQYLQLLSNFQLKPRCLAFPGCWGPGVGDSFITRSVNWRFCGGFFIGDRESLLDFHTATTNAFRHLYETEGRIVWEVNTWALAEKRGGFSPTWYKADHNDSIIRIPQSLFRVVASLTTIPSRVDALKETLDSLLPQVDHIYLSVAEAYVRFGGVGITLPSYLCETPYVEKVTVVKGPDHGPASKYLGALSALPSQSWVFICDDDQIYAPDVVRKMLQAVHTFGVYQNRYAIIEKSTSGGLVHGYVGLLVPTQALQALSVFPLPDCARYVDDQWISTYFFFQDVPIYPTGVEEYKDIYATLCGWHELIGADALGSLGNRSAKVAELAAFFKIRFEAGGRITSETAPIPIDPVGE
jgi:hypothetical protein